MEEEKEEKLFQLSTFEKKDPRQIREILQKDPLFDVLFIGDPPKETEKETDNLEQGEIKTEEESETEEETKTKKETETEEEIATEEIEETETEEEEETETEEEEETETEEEEETETEEEEETERKTKEESIEEDGYLCMHKKEQKDVPGGHAFISMTNCRGEDFTHQIRSLLLSSHLR